MRFTLLLAIFFLSSLVLLAHDAAGHDDDDNEAAGQNAIGVPEQPSYHEHVRPIIEANCASCHTEGQIAAYAPFDDPQDVIFAAQDIKFHVVYRLMPPWMPSPNNLPLANDRSLSDVEIATIAAWVDAGADLGDPHDFKPAESAGVDFAEIRADMTLQLEEAYVPDEDIIDDYRCFAFPLTVEEPQFITGYEFVPDVVEMAHHNLVFLFDEEADRAIERRDNVDGRPGWSCHGGPGLATAGAAIGGWAPGASPVAFPDGAGILIKPGQQIVLEMHYNLWASRQPDRSRLILQLEPAESELTELMIVSMAAPVEIPCPSGSDGPQCEREAAIERAAELYGERSRNRPDYLLRRCGQELADYAANTGANARGSCDYPVTGSLTLYSVSGHMHKLGRSFRLELNPESEEPLLLLDIPDWDFHWQDHYYFVEPLEVVPGDILRITCAWDNSLADDPRYVVWGEGTSEEMCLGTVLARKA